MIRNGKEKDRTFFHGQRRSMSSNSPLNNPQDPGGTAQSMSKKDSDGAAHNTWGFFDDNTLQFARKSRLPFTFFLDLHELQEKVEQSGPELKHDQDEAQPDTPQPTLNEQMRLMKSMRELEEKLAKTRAKLSESLQVKPQEQEQQTSPVLLSRDDFKGLVDLYYHTHHSRFDPESPDSSPTPTFLEDYVFKLSEDFAPPQAYADFYTNDEDYVSPLEEVEKTLKSRQLHEITVMRAFVDLLLDDHSSNAAVFRAYQRLPQPGVAFLPTGTIRVFLQRMSTPWQKNEKSMLRYLSLIDDMQKANLPISKSEWASAIYLAGRSFARVTEAEVNTSFRIWKQMEQEAGVVSHHVTFNILFDIAVRANKYPLAQMVLKEMHDRGLRLNRLGRVSVIYYHGLRQDGDAVRKAYRDFVDAGEIVDTLVLNCVMAALYNAQEPTAAEQIYERMKSLQLRTREEKCSDGTTALYRRYPGPGEDMIERELAANALGRVLLSAARLKHILPDNHRALQDSMPLAPDHVTFRTMISYHANVSGNLHRITVLMKEMSELFGLSFQTINYQLLFKGFALHGATMDPDATWNVQRLNMAWDACRNAIKDEQDTRRRARSSKPPDPTLPSIPAINDLSADSEQVQQEGQRATEQQIALKRLSAWNEFVIDLAVFPRERRKHIERIHAELFDEEPARTRPPIANPFLRSVQRGSPPPDQETYYPLGERKLDLEEGEYVLPPPTLAIDPSSQEVNQRIRNPSFSNQSNMPMTQHLANPNRHELTGDTGQNDTSHSSKDDLSVSRDDRLDADQEDEDGEDMAPALSNLPYRAQANRPMVCWLLRAYSRSTGSRRQVEEVWNSVRKIWRPRDAKDRDAVVRVLRRCLRDCDRYGPPL